MHYAGDQPQPQHPPRYDTVIGRRHLPLPHVQVILLLASL